MAFWERLFNKKRENTGYEGRESSCGHLRTLKGHKAGIICVAISSDGKFAVSGSYDMTLKLWDLSTWKCIKTFSGHFGYVECVAISPDGKYAISGSSGDRTLKLWNLLKGGCLRTLTGHPGMVRSVAITPDNRFALSGGQDKCLRLWDLSTGQCVQTYDAVVNLRDPELGRVIKSAFANVSSPIFCSIVNSISISPDGKFAAWGDSNNTIWLWNLPRGQCLRELKGHAAAVVSVTISSDSKYILSGSEDQTLRLWDIATGNCLRTFMGHTGAVSSVVIDPSVRFAVSAGIQDKTIKLWDMQTGQCLETIQGHSESIRSVVFDPNGKFVISGSTDKTLKLWKFSAMSSLNYSLANEPSIVAAPLNDPQDQQRGISVMLVALRWDLSPLTKQELRSRAAQAVQKIDPQFNKDVMDVKLLEVNEEKQYVQLSVRANFRDQDEQERMKDMLRKEFGI